MCNKFLTSSNLQNSASEIEFMSKLKLDLSRDVQVVQLVPSYGEWVGRGMSCNIVPVTCF